MVSEACSRFHRHHLFLSSADGSDRGSSWRKAATVASLRWVQASLAQCPGLSGTGTMSQTSVGMCKQQLLCDPRMNTGHTNAVMNKGTQKLEHMHTVAVLCYALQSASHVLVTASSLQVQPAGSHSQVSGELASLCPGTWCLEGLGAVPVTCELPECCHSFQSMFLNDRHNYT